MISVAVVVGCSVVGGAVGLFAGVWWGERQPGGDDLGMGSALYGLAGAGIGAVVGAGVGGALVG